VQDDLTLKVGVRGAEEATKKVRGVNDAIDGTGRSSDKSGSMLAKFSNVAKVAAVAITAVAAAGVAYAVSASKAYAEVESINAQLRHAVIDVSHATEAQLKATSDLSDELERKGVLDGDNIKLGLAQLSTFGLSNKAVQALGGSLADLAVNQFGVNASGEQLSDTANMIAKALNGQFGVLEKSGIRFSEAQRQMILYGTETQKVTAINEGFAQNLKYTNDVAKTTVDGGLARLRVQMGNVQEAIGAVINKAMGPFINKALDLFDSIGGVDGIMKVLGDTFNRTVKTLKPIIDGVINVAKQIGSYLGPKLQDLWSSIATHVIPIFQALWRNTLVPLAGFLGGTFIVVLGKTIDTFAMLSKGATYLIPAIGALVVALTAYNIVQTVTAHATGVATLAMGLFNAVTKANPIALVISAVAGLAAGLMLLWTTLGVSKEATEDLNFSRKRQQELADAARDAENRLRDAELSAQGAALTVERAQRTYNDTVAQYGPKSLEAREAAYQLKRAQNDLATANNNAKQATNENRDAQARFANPAWVATITNAIYKISGAYGTLSVQASNASGQILQAAASAERFQGTSNSIQITGGGNLQGGSTRLQGNAVGTDFWQGGPTWVGEQGPEIVNLPRGSQVIPNNKAVSAGTTNTFTGNIILGDAGAAREFFNQLDKDNILVGKGLTATRGF